MNHQNAGRGVPDRFEDPARHSAFEVLRVFLTLGLISFGGPIAHIGYFRSEFVMRRRWLDDATYTDLVALCQFLPGPTSSQVGFSIGLLRAGYLGGLAAWMGFTLPSATALVLFAYGAHALTGPIGTGLLHGLKLVAVAIVAQAVVGMLRTLCPDRQRLSIAALAMILILYSSSTITQIGAILLGALAGTLVCRTGSAVSTVPMIMPISRRIGAASLAIFLLLLFGLPLAQNVLAPSGLAQFNAFYRSGALVFGGGHVVLPLLRDALVTPGWISDDTFLTGYGVAQAIPGPLFAIAAYLGVFAAPTPNGVIGAVLAIIGIFLPGMLLLLGTLPFWGRLRARTEAQAAVRGIGAAVVGLLGAALYNPVWTNSVHSPADLGVALMGFVLLTVWHWRPLLVVSVSALSGIILALLPLQP